MPEEDEAKSGLKSEIAELKPRDEKGHFIRVEKPQNPKGPQNPISRFFSKHTRYSKNQDDLLDIRVGNPLRRIVHLLEDIKKQRAFSFTLKGSLGIMGVFLALSVFGIFGGGQILCDRGNRTEIGVIKTLSVLESDSSTIPVLSRVLDYFAPRQWRNKVVLIRNDETVINLPYSRKVDFTKYVNYPVIATGSYNSCSQSLTITEPNGLQVYTR